MRFSDCSFFFKQKTAYELRISDWRSDVCSSDLPTNQFWHLLGVVIDRPLANMPYDERLAALRDAKVGLWDVIRSAERRPSSDSLIDRKSVVSGKRGSVRVEPGGRRIIKRKKTQDRDRRAELSLKKQKNKK